MANANPEAHANDNPVHPPAGTRLAVLGQHAGREEKQALQVLQAGQREGYNHSVDKILVASHVAS